jgi:hypothetical protein
VFEAGAIILAGGRSSRMGSPKAALDWHGSTLLRRVTGLVQRTVDGPVVVVRAPAQELPELPPSIQVATDAREGRGPLQGLAAGLAAIGDRAAIAYVSSTDVPLLHPGDYDEARALPAPAIDVRRPGTPATNGAARVERVAAWTLGQLADTLGLVLDEHIVATLNGDHVTCDRELPLAAGDTVEIQA